MLGLLMIGGMLNFVDRKIIIILQEPIKAEFQLSDAQLGLLIGSLIPTVYAVASVPLARLVDRGVSRVFMVSLLVSVWSLFTAVGGLVRTFGQLIIARVGVGVADGGFTLSAYSLISDLYPPAQRPLALSILALGVPLGIMFGLSLGGYLAHNYGWRSALLIVGIPGLLLGAIFALVGREPVRGGAEPATADHEAAPPSGNWISLLRDPVMPTCCSAAAERLS